VQFVDNFPRTADGKVHLFPPAMDAGSSHGLYTWQPDPGTAEFPLTLISPAHGRAVSSSLGQLIRKQVPVDMNPHRAGFQHARRSALPRPRNGGHPTRSGADSEGTLEPQHAERRHVERSLT
jgi:hypothetical protein